MRGVIHTDSWLSKELERVQLNNSSGKKWHEINFILINVSAYFVQGGVKTTVSTFKWMLLFIAYYPDIQRKLKNEIQREIGDKIMLIENKNKLNFCMAFISEILRFKTPGPIGIPHKTQSNTKLGIK